MISVYSGMGFAILILFLKTPLAQMLSAASAGDPWHQANVPVLASSFLMMCFWIVGIRVAFAMPLELRANWIFKIAPLRGGTVSLAASRRAMHVIALVPLWAASAALLLWFWPWRPAVGHLVVLGIVGLTLIELCLHGFRKIPCTCSYLPGKSNLHITLYLCLMLGLNLTYWAASFERRALSDAAKYAWMGAVLTAAAAFAWHRTATAATSDESSLQFEEEMPPEILSLGLHRDGIFPTDSSSESPGS